MQVQTSKLRQTETETEDRQMTDRQTDKARQRERKREKARERDANRKRERERKKARERDRNRKRASERARAREREKTKAKEIDSEHRRNSEFISMSVLNFSFQLEILTYLYTQKSSICLAHRSLSLARSFALSRFRDQIQELRGARGRAGSSQVAGGERGRAT